MDRPWRLYAKSDRKRQIPYNLTYIWNVRKQKQKSQIPAHRYREQIGGCQRLGRDGAERQCEMGEGSWKVQTSGYKISKSWGGNIQHGDYSW